jgi:membrane protease YdiL (CAAX protease family)
LEIEDGYIVEKVSAIAQERSSAPMPRARWLPVVVGLTVACGVPMFALDWAIVPFLSGLRLSAGVEQGMVNLANALGVTITLLALVLCWERLPLKSVGIRAVRFEDFLLGLAVWMGLGVAQDQVTAIYQFAHGKAGAMQAGSSVPGKLPEFAGIPIALFLSMIAVTAFAEELATRAYPIERIEALTGRRLPALACAFALSLGIHLPLWGLRYAILIGPGELLLTLVYQWQRRLAPCLFAHLLYNLLPFHMSLTFWQWI